MVSTVRQKTHAKFLLGQSSSILDNDFEAMHKIDLMVTGLNPKVLNKTSDVALSPFRAAKDGTGAAASTLQETAGDHNASQSEQRGATSAQNDAHDAPVEHEP